MLPRELEIEKQMNMRGWDYTEAEAWYELQVARELAAGPEFERVQADASAPPLASGHNSSHGPAASFQCTPCPCGGLCDNCGEG